MIKINNLFNIEKGGSLFLWLFLPFLVSSILVFKLSDITDKIKLWIILSLLFSYLIIFVILFLIKVFRKGGEKEKVSKENKKDKKESEDNKSAIEEENEYLKKLFLASAKRKAIKGKKISELKEEISKLEAQINHLKNK